MGKRIRNWRWEALCLAVYAAIAGVQLFKTPIVGVADNGDFPKVLGHLDVCDSHEYNQYVVYRYRIGRECRWDSHLTSSEAVFVRIIKQFAAWNQDYDISVRAEGRAHLIVVLAALAILLWALRKSRPIFRFGIPVLVILIFSDVAYVAYLNSFYMDAASMVFLMLTISLAIAAVLRPQPWSTIAFGIAAVFFVTSKSQHALLGPLLAGLAAWFAVSSPQGRSRRWMACAIAALAATVAMTMFTTAEYRAFALYNLTFFRLAKQSPNPGETLRELGLPPTYLPLVGTYSFNPGVPATDPKWQVEFLARTSFSKLAAYYLRHPEVAFRGIRETLSVDAEGIRASYLGNYLRQDGYPPGALARHFGMWSQLRSWLFHVWPFHAVVLYVLVCGGCAWCWFRPAVAAEWPLYPVCLVLAAGGAIEFVCSALLDCLETARHLFLFHVITEMLIVFAVAALLDLRKFWTDRPKPVTQEL